MKDSLRILHLEDSPKDAELIEATLAGEGLACEVALVDTREDFVAALEQGGFDLILADYGLTSFDGLSALRIAKEKCPHVPFILVSGTLGEEVAIESLKLGATDYVLKHRLSRLVSCTKRALREVEEMRERRRAEDEVKHNLERIRALHEIDLAITSTLDLRTILDVLLEKIDLFLAYPTASTVRLLNKESGALEPVACRNLNEVVWKADEWKSGRGPANAVFQDKALLIVGNVQTDPRIRDREFFQRYGLVSYLGVPLIAKREVLGVLGLYTKQEHEFGAEEIEFLNTLAGQAAIAIHNAQLHEEIQLNLKRIRALHEIDTAISSTLDIRTVLNVLLEKIELFLRIAAASTVRLLNRETGDLESLACRGFDEQEWRSQARAVLGGRAQRVVETKAPVVSANIHTDERTYDMEIFRKRGLISYLGVPLIAHDKVLGVLSIYSRQEHEFSKEEIDFLNTLAGQAAIAIHNAQLYEEVGRSKSELELTNAYLEKSLRQLSGLYTALGPLAPSVTISEMMDGIIERLTQATGADAALIRLHDKDKGSFYWASQRGFPDYYLKAVESPPQGSSLEQVFNSEEPIIVSDIASDPRLRGKVQLQVGLRSCAMLPLKVYDEVRGIVHLASFQLGYFDEEQRDHLMTIARQLGIALENKELFDNLKASRDKLDRANKVKDEFLSVMSHELRTPLSVVMGYTGLIKEGTLGAVNEQQKEALQKVMTRAADQLNMIDDIMQTTQLEARGVSAHREFVDLCDLLDKLKSDYEIRADKKDIRLNWHYPAAAMSISTDGAKLKQILQNLINNGLKFTDEGSVTVSVRIIADKSNPQSPTQPRFVEFTVADTGIGIPKEAQDSIFHKFHQVDSSETRLYGGVGLGLYIVKNFTDLLGGTVEVDSEPGKGSTFTIAIPCAE